ncbi:MAG: hypothetical protein WCE95_08720, partial [Nitrososphaeraceae archaeon]
SPDLWLTSSTGGRNIFCDSIGQIRSSSNGFECNWMDQDPNQRQWNTSIVLDEPDGAERDNWSPYT